MVTGFHKFGLRGGNGGRYQGSQCPELYRASKRQSLDIITCGALDFPEEMPGRTSHSERWRKSLEDQHSHRTVSPLKAKLITGKTDNQHGRASGL